MHRFALSLLLASLAMAPAAQAEGTRSLGVTVAPVGAFALGGGASSLTGYSATLGWSFSRPGEWFSLGGHLATSARFTEATPVTVRITALPGRRVRPFLGLGASLMIFHPGAEAPWGRSGDELRVGPVAAAGLGADLGRSFFLELEGRYFNYPYADSFLSNRRVQVTSAYLGLGVRL